jgi:predicted dehydrogenase
MESYTRRQFLEDSILAAAVAAALPASSLLAAAEKEKKRKRLEAGKKDPGQLLQVAVVGVGGRGREHIREYLRHPNTEIAYVVDVDEKIGRGAAEAIGNIQGRVPKLVKDLRTALDDKSVNIVSIATPNHWHALAAIWSMQAGKDVYVEKPVSHNVSEGRRMVETARQHNRICQVGMQRRSLKGPIDAVEYIASGKIGEVKLGRGLCYKPRLSIGPKGRYEVPKEVDYNLWCGPARMLPLTRKKFHYDWHFQREWGNGDMGNQGPHQLDVARWGLGLNRLADSVICFGGRLGYEDAGDVANTEVAIYDFGDKTLVFEVRGLESDPLRNAKVGEIFYGSEGYVVMTKYNLGAAFDLKNKRMEVFGRNDGVSDDSLHFFNFIDAVKARDPKRLHCDILEGHLTCAHSHLANVSYYLGKPATTDEIKKALGALKTHEDTADCLQRTIEHLAKNKINLRKTPLTLGALLKIDQDNETVLDNPEACALLTREYRAPFIVPKAGEV